MTRDPGSENLFRAAFDASPSGMLVVARDGMIRMANEEAERLFGFGSGELVGARVDSLVPEGSRHHHAMLRDGFVAAPTSRPMGNGRPLNGRRRDGSTFPVEIGLRPVEVQNEVVVLATIVDMTALRTAAEDLERANSELLRSNAALEQFAYVASHDLKAPLKGIGTLAQWIADDLADHPSVDVREHLELMQGRVVRLIELLDGLLEYARAGHRRADAEEIDVGALVASVVELLDAPPTFDVVCAPGLPRINAPRAPLGQVFRNLIANAIAHHDRTHGRVTVDGWTEGRFHVFEITDDGPGIPSEARERVFRMFETLKPRDVGGGSTGLGLAVVSRIVGAQGGQVSIRSAEPRGTTVRFTWAIEVPDTSPPTTL